MKTKIKVLAILAIVITGLGFTLTFSEKAPIMLEPDFLYIRVSVSNIPYYVESCAMKIYVGGQLWDETTIDPYNEPPQYNNTHQNFDGTIIVKVYYEGNDNCLYWGESYETAYFYYGHNAIFSISSFPSSICD